MRKIECENTWSKVPISIKIATHILNIILVIFLLMKNAIWSVFLIVGHILCFDGSGRNKDTLYEFP